MTRRRRPEVWGGVGVKSGAFCYVKLCRLRFFRGA